MVGAGLGFPRFINAGEYRTM